MLKRKVIVFNVLIVAVLFFLLSFQFNEWLSLTMPRHQLLQLPGMFVLGILLSYCFPDIKIKNISYGISGVIFIMASMIFWMLPRSVDLAVLHPSINRIMHVNMLIAGFLATAILKNTTLELKMFFLEMTVAMLLATGITLRAFDMLLCSSFTIEQQHETGLYLILIASALFVGTLVMFFRALNKGGKKVPVP